MESGPVQALAGVDLEVEMGESLAIMGASGSGKSTLMHLIGCLDKPTEGTYHFHGQDISKLDDDALSAIRATQIGFVFQDYNLIPQYTVSENVAAPFFYHKEGEDERAICAAIERVGLSSRAHHRPDQLSGGEQQRVTIARAIVRQPLLICADEPTGSLDSVTGKSILTLFHELISDGVTLILVTHDERVASTCQRMIRLKDGRIVE